MKQLDIISISGGKDSAALAIYLKQKYPNKKFKYIFFDTKDELPETYEYLARLEIAIEEKIERIYPKKTFDELLIEHHNFLPSPQQRWCTKRLKIDTFLEFIKQYEDYKINNYVGIRADEDRKGLVVDGVNTIMPFKEDGITLNDVKRILYEAGVGLPKYYDEVYDKKYDITYYRSRSGCYFCFFMRQIEWVWLYEKHPELFKKAMEYEKEGYSWIKGMPLKEIVSNIDRIKTNYKKQKQSKKNQTLFESVEEGDICSLCV